MKTLLTTGQMIDQIERGQYAIGQYGNFKDVRLEKDCKGNLRYADKTNRLFLSLDFLTNKWEISEG